MTSPPGPRAYLVGKTTFLVDAYEAFVADQGMRWERTGGAAEADEIVEAAGRVCYMAYGETHQKRRNPDYIRHLIRAGHESVLEHACFSFVLCGVSRAFSHQLVRHRVGWSFSQLSQQYHEETDPTFVEPALLATMPELRDKWVAATRASLDLYREVLSGLKEGTDATEDLSQTERKRAIRTAARSLLPNATPTALFVTANARALRHFLRLRGDIPGDEEMRRVAAVLLELLQLEAPRLFEDFAIELGSDGIPRVVLAEGGGPRDA